MLGLSLSLILMLSGCTPIGRCKMRTTTIASAAAAVKASASSSDNDSCPSSSPAALIFLHGLGDTPAGWSSLQQELTLLCHNLKEMKYIFPHAPTIGITINGGMQMPGWFDLYDWPIGLNCKDDRPGIFKAMAQVTQEIEKLESQGIPRNRIVVGGFSQGAAIALETVYRSKDKFAACIALSGWLTLRDDLVVSDEAKKTPLFWGHGKYDDKVLFEHQFFGVKKLRDQGVPVTHTEYPIGHGSDPDEMDDMAAFLDSALFGDDTKEGAKGEAATQTRDES
jgi:lysophospholipase-2